MAEGVAANCARAILFMFNFVFWLTGLALIAFGVWLLCDYTAVTYIRFVTLKHDDPEFLKFVCSVIGLGVFVVIVGFSGCCGAIRESRCLLVTYATFLILVLIGECAALVVMWLFRSRMEQWLMVAMREQMQDSYQSNTTTAEYWDYMQSSLECCGALGPGDWVESDWFFSDEATDGAVQVLYVPWSCCRSQPLVYTNSTSAQTNISQCQGEAAVEQYRPSYLYKMGCYDGLLSWVRSNALMLVVVGGALAILQMVGLVFACCLIRAVHEEKRVGVMDGNGFAVGAAKTPDTHVEYC